MHARKLAAATSAIVMTGVAWGQIPDLINAFDAGGRAMGLGGSIYTAGSDTMSSINNPAGLAYADTATFGVVFRNMPESTTAVTNDFNNPTLDTKATGGRRAISHAGYNFPALGGAIGIAYTTQGYIRDLRTGDNLSDNGLTVRNYAELLKLKTDFITMSYGKHMGGGLSLGAGLVVGINYLRDRTKYDLVDGGGNNRGTVDTDDFETATGIGAVAGFQFTPKGSPNTSIGGSIRTPISLNHRSTVASFYNRIPMRLSLGVASRADGLRGGKDSMLYGVQADAFLMNGAAKLINRKKQFNVGAGVEYLYAFNPTLQIPIRLGFNAIQGAGTGYGDRNAFTFGVGYRPSSSTNLDLNFASPGSGRGWDMALGITYRFGK